MPKIRDEIQVAPDKSISHRALMISAIAEGTSRIKNFLNADDCISTMNCLKKLGVEISNKKDEVIVKGNGLKLKESKEILDAGNSGTTVRLLSGILAGQEFLTRITGDESLSQRPMKRIVEPLEKMGACVKTNNGCLPIEIKGGNLNLIHYESKISSAQLKSCVLLAGLYADNITGFTEPEKSRDHTERMLKNFGAEVFVNWNTVSVRGKAKLRATDVFVPGDISSAAFFIVAAAIVKNSKLKIKNVGINSTRVGIVDVLRSMGAKLSIKNKVQVGNEPMGDIEIETSDLKSTEIKKEDIFERNFLTDISEIKRLNGEGYVSGFMDPYSEEWIKFQTDGNVILSSDSMYSVVYDEKSKHKFASILKKRYENDGIFGFFRDEDFIYLDSLQYFKLKTINDSHTGCLYDEVHGIYFYFSNLHDWGANN